MILHYQHKIVLCGFQIEFTSFGDDHTKITLLFLMKEKSEVCHIFRKFNIKIQTKYQTKIQVPKTDNRKEYFEKKLDMYLKKDGIFHQSSCLDTPKQNGIAEKKNKHFLEVAGFSKDWIFSMIAVFPSGTFSVSCIIHSIHISLILLTNVINYIGCDIYPNAV